MIAADVRAAVEEAVSAQERITIRIESAAAASGGCINQAYHLTFSNGMRLFLKANPSAPPGMFAREAEGLELLRSAGSVRVPQVYCVTGGKASTHFLLLEDVMEPTSSDHPAINSADLGAALAGIHRVTAECFGLEDDNYIGATRQPNGWHDNWPAFFSEHRIGYMLQLLEAGGAETTDLRAFHNALPRLEYLLSQREPEPPSLVHGDLWSGNVLTAASGEPVLIDPAVYFGDREVDLAMTHLFGDFDGEFYDSYNEVYPLQDTWRERQDIYNLYHLLHHALLFGGGYLKQACTLLAKLST